MATGPALHGNNLIEYAGMQAASDRQRRSVIDLQPAMTRRLAQLRAALGEDSPAAAAPAAHAVPPDSRPATSHISLFDLLGACLLSAVLGAASMTIVTSRQNAEPTRPAALPVSTAPVTAPAAPVIAPPAEAQGAASDEAAVGALLSTWRTAWAERDVAAYLAAYGSDFTPADGSPRTAWADGRRKKLSAAPRIDLQIRDLHLERLDAGRFRATFVQDYAAGGYRETGRHKEMLIAQEGNAWRIVGERQQ